MTNREKSALTLKDCTGLARWGDSTMWSAVIRKGNGDYRDPAGLKIKAPDAYYKASLEHILDIYDRQGVSALTMAPT